MKAAYIDTLICFSIPLFLLSLALGVTVPLRLAAVLVIILGALGITLSRYKAHHAVILCVGAAIGCFVAFQGNFIQSGSIVRTAVSSERIVEIQGKLIADSTVSSKGKQVLQVRLETGTDRNGTVGTAKGVVTVISRDSSLLTANTHVRVVGTFSQGEEGVFFTSKELWVRGEQNRIRSYFIQLRVQAIEAVAKRLFGDEMEIPPSRLLSGLLLLGKSDGVYHPLKRETAQSGCAHILALSGMHLQILASISTTVGMVILGRRRAWWVSIPIVISFLFLAGPVPSLIRAALMFFLAKVNVSKLRTAPVGLAFFLQLFLFPDTIMSWGCLLSYAALCGILCFPRLPVTVSALLFSSGCSLILLGVWYPVGVVLSPIAGLLITLIMACSLFLLVSETAMLPLNWLYGYLERLMGWGAKVSEHLSWLSSWYTYILLCMVLLTVFAAIRYAKHILRKRNQIIRELELCLRITYSHYRSAFKAGALHEQEVWTKLSAAPANSGEHC